MMRALKIISISLVLLALAGLSGYYFYKNKELNKSYEAATQQVTQLQAKLNAVGTFADVLTVKTSVRMGQEITDADLVLQTIPTSSVPANVITDRKSIVGKYFRIGFEPGITLTNDLINIEEYIGSVYDRDLHLDGLPVGTQVGDYLDIRMVLPGGEEFIVFPHKRVNARFENTIKMRFDEADLWLYTSMTRDKALYKSVGLQIYATKYNDPGAHDKTVAYYPVRKEVVDIMNVSGNLTDKQKARMWNESLRASIDAKLKFYSDPLNKDASAIQSGVSSEESRQNAAGSYYDSGQANGTIPTTPGTNTGTGGTNTETGGTGLVDPNTPATGTENLGNLGGNTGTTPTTPSHPGTTNPVNESSDYLDNLEENLFDDESPIE